MASTRQLLALTLALTSSLTHAREDEYGGGIVVQTGPSLAALDQSIQRTVPAVGLTGLVVYKDSVRIGGEAHVMFGPVIQGGMAGPFSDLVVDRYGNMKSYVGLGAGLGGGRFLWGDSPYTTAFLYLQPTAGLQFNLKYAALQVELNYTLPLTLLPSPEGFYPGHIGLSMGFLGGEFPPFKKTKKSAPQRPGGQSGPQAPPPGPRHPSGSRRPPG